MHFAHLFGSPPPLLPKYSCRPQPIGWSTEHGLSQPSTWGLGGGQLEDAFQDVLEDVPKCKYYANILRYPHRLLRRGICMDVAVSSNLEVGRFFRR